MASYTTLDYIADLTNSEMTGARVLTFTVASTNSSGWDYSSIVYGSEPNAAAHGLYRFNAFEGATYDFFSTSNLDPFLLRVYDSLGNAILVNGESDDPAPFKLSDGGTYNADVIYSWKAPYTGNYYINASWNQGTTFSYYDLAVYENIDTVVGNHPPLLAQPLPDLDWVEGQLLKYVVPASTFTDVDGQALTYSARLVSGGALPAWLSFDPATRTFLGTAPVGTADISVRVTATDAGGLTASDDMVLFTPSGAAAINGTSDGDKLVGTSAADTLYGLGGDDFLDGGDGNDKLYGGDGNDVFDWDSAQRGGADRFEGGAGNDTYVLNSTGDLVVETPEAGNDTIWTTFSLSLDDIPHVENLYGFGTASLTLTGNSLGNALRGSTGDDRLTGGGGNDRLEGGTGNDTAVFSGAFADYVIGYNSAAGSFTVTDKVAGRDGIDTLVGIETLSFKDGSRKADPNAFDGTAPVVLTFDPADEAVGVAVSVNLTLNFSEAVQRGAGTIVLRSASGAAVESYNAATSTNLTITGSTLVVNPTANLAAGTGYQLELPAGSIKDLAGNSYAGTTSYNFTTRPADDFGGNTSTQGVLTTGQSVSGAIESAGDSDWFGISLVAGRNYQFRLDGQTLADPSLVLYGANGVQLTSDDDGGAGLNAQITFTPTTSGTYFLAANAYPGTTGSYRLSAAQVAADDYANNSSTTGRLTVGATLKGNIESDDDEDWIAVTLTAGQAYRFTLNGSTQAGNTLKDPLLGVFSATGVLLDYDDDSGGNLDAQLDFTATASGTYYLAVVGIDGTGTYSLGVQTMVSDDFPASSATSGKLAIGGSVSGRLEANGDRDWIAVTLTAGQQYQFRLDGVTLADPSLSLRTSSGFELLSDDDSGIDLNALINFRPTTSGTYYLDVGGYQTQTGTYTLSAAVAVTDDYAASSSTTGVVAVGGSVNGKIDAAADEDWFSVSLVAGQTYQFKLESTGLADPVLALLSSNGTVLSRDDDAGGGKNSLIKYTAVSSGVHYLDAKAYDSGTGTYRLSVSQVAASDDFANGPATTGRVTVGGSTTGRIESVNDSDWFAITLSAGQNYQFKLNGTGPADPLLKLYNAAGALLTSDDDGGEGANSLISYTAPAAGTYYLGAEFQSGGLGDYTLSAAATTVTSDSSFSIKVVYSGDPRYQQYFERAAARWAQIIIGDLPNVTDATYGLIDDLLIVASVEAIDGVDGILGQAGPTGWRSGSVSAAVPYKATMRFDSADLAAMEAAGTLESVVLHEMAHSLGMTANAMQVKGLVSGTTYIGANGVAAYRQLTGNLGLTSVPLETTGGAGTAGAHWLETLFDSELMTGYAEDRPPMPLSILTVGCMADLGYLVDYTWADPYTIPNGG